MEKFITKHILQYDSRNKKYGLKIDYAVKHKLTPTKNQWVISDFTELELKDFYQPLAFCDYDAGTILEEQLPKAKKYIKTLNDLSRMNRKEAKRKAGEVSESLEGFPLFYKGRPLHI